MRNKIKKCFTLIELMVSIAIIGIVSAILIPQVIQVYGQSTNNIVEIYNHETQVICYYNDTILYEGDQSTMPDFTDEYKLTNIKSVNGIIYMYFERLENNN